MDTIATAVYAEELGRSTFGGVAITALVHTDMASVHVFNAGSEAQKDKWMPGIIAGEVITAVAVTEPDAGSDVKGIRTVARRDGDVYVLDGAKMFITNGVHADLYCVAAKTDAARHGRASRSPCSWSRKARPASPSAARSTSMAGARPTPRSCISTAAASRRTTCSAKRAAASTPS